MENSASALYWVSEILQLLVATSYIRTVVYLITASFVIVVCLKFLKMFRFLGV